MVKTPQIILIDGPAGSGKTTLALKLQSELNCQVIHLDSIYNGWEDALTDTLTRKLQEILDAFLANRPFEVPIFNWELGKFDGSRTITPDSALIIEGVGAGQSAIRPFATTIYWVEADDEIGLARVLKRDGIAILDQMKIWKTREAQHFATERTREFADFIISTN
jgi:uridine kinase